MGIRRALALLIIVCTNSYAQLSNSTYSPYSLFGMGRFNDANTGITNSLGKSGVAVGSEFEMNGLNPASLAQIHKNSFFFDIGLKTEYNDYGDKNNTDSKQTLYNFSNIGFAFPLTEKSGLSVSLLPFTEVGYYFKGIVSNIDGGSTQTQSTITGSGGLNNFNINYGRIISPKFAVGLSAKYFFGSIKQTEVVQLESNYLTIQDINYYNGYKFELGMQYLISNRFRTGATINFPSVLKGSRDRTVNKIVDHTSTTIENTADIGISNFKTPFDFTLGIKYNYRDYSFLSDYKRTFWSSTGIVDNIGRYTDSNILGVGIEYFKRNSNYAYQPKPRFRYRLGYNFDDGNLKVNGNKIANNTWTAGIGIPFGKNYNTYLNISYSYGTKGLISNTLIKENYHTLTFNLSFEDKWFVRRRFE